MPDLDDLLDMLWADYVDHNPQAREIVELLAGEGEFVENDHIAFRTYNHPDIGMNKLGYAFEKFGYEKGDQHYEFSEKKLDAYHWEHPDPDYPKVFISELRVQVFSDEFKEIVNRLVEQVPKELPNRWDFPALGRPWEVSHEEVGRLREESEYGAWMATWGFRANHFTVDVNALDKYSNLEDLNRFLKDNGIELNDRGGEIKGSPDVYLEQSSTKAPEVEVDFNDGTYEEPFCYYEFAKRYEKPDGELFQGFVADSADKIFESTDKQ
ncbi:MAG: DUF1338 domain-containing protein [bacterium]